MLYSILFLVCVASANPRNWGRRKKWRQIVMVSFFTLMRYAVPLRQELVNFHMRLLQPNSFKYACTSTPRNLKRAEDAPRSRDKVRSTHSGMFSATDSERLLCTPQFIVQHFCAWICCGATVSICSVIIQRFTDRFVHRFLAPLSEILGRQIILQAANMFFLSMVAAAFVCSSS